MIWAFFGDTFGSVMTTVGWAVSWVVLMIFKLQQCLVTTLVSQEPLATEFWLDPIGSGFLLCPVVVFAVHLHS